MSDAATPLAGAQDVSGIARVGEAPLQGMITVRAMLSDPEVMQALGQVSGIDMPGPGETAAQGALRLCWMSPDEALLLCPYAEARAIVAHLERALHTTHALIVNVSDARAAFDLSGAHARDVLAKLCPVDLASEAFGESSFRRTRMAQVPAAFWLTGAEQFRIVTFRSHARYLFDLLVTAARPGSEVGHLVR